MLTVINPPEPLFSPAEARGFLRVVSTRDDLDIERGILTATAHLDGINGVLGQCVVTQTMRLDLFSLDRVTHLPLGPNSAVSEVAYFDQTGTRNVLSASAYFVAQDALGFYLKIKDSVSVPPVDPDRPNAVQITFTAGFGPPAAVPQPIKSAVLILVATLFNYREMQVTERVYESSFGVDDLLAPYRRVF
jgi:uncharacterized phiE125 gp8 family phage protein